MPAIASRTQETADAATGSPLLSVRDLHKH